jgi:hypothetical protein
MCIYIMLLVNEIEQLYLRFEYIDVRLIFSEENIWKLCETWKQNDPDHLKYLYAVFISNRRRQIPMWEQKSSSTPEHLVIWV